MKLLLQRFINAFKNKKTILISVLIVVVICSSAILFFVLNPPKAQNENLPSIQVTVSGGSLDAGNSILTSALRKKTVEYSEMTTLSSFVGIPYKVEWKSSLDTMARKPLDLFIPIPSDYYLGDTTANLEGVEIVNGLPYTLYGGQVRTIDNLHYLEVPSYFPGNVALKLANFSSNYGLIPLNKVSDGEANLVIVPGSNVNFSGNIPGRAQNLWVQNFQKYNVYLFSYPITRSRDLTYTSEMLDYFKKTGVDSYTQYSGYLLSNLLKTLTGPTYIVAQGVGGLIARYAIDLDRSSANVKKAVLFDTPNLGTGLASAYDVSNLYNAGKDYADREFQCSTDAFDYAMNSSVNYLRMLNFFAKDLAPGSAFLKKLDASNPSTGTLFMAIAGTNPGISIKRFGGLAGIFPEFVKNLGDGVVSVKSALAFGSLKDKFPYSFTDIFVHQDVLNAVAKFISVSNSSTSTAFKSDNFVETKKATSSSDGLTFISSSTTVSTRSFKYLSGGDYIVKPASEKKLFDLTYSVKIPDALKIEPVQDGVYSISGNSVRFLSIGGQQLTYSGKVRFTNEYGGILYLVTGDWQLLKFQDASSKLAGTIKAKEYQSVFDKNGQIYTLQTAATSTYLVDLQDDEKLLKIPGTHGFMRYFSSRDSFVIITDSYVAVYDVKDRVGKFFDKTSMIAQKAGFKRDQSFPISSVYLKGDLLYLLSSNYVLMAVDINTHGVQIIGNGNVGGLELLSYGNLLLVIGKHTVNLYDTANRVKLPFYQHIKDSVDDARISGGSLLILGEKGGTWNFEIYKPNF